MFLQLRRPGVSRLCHINYFYKAHIGQRRWENVVVVDGVTKEETVVRAKVSLKLVKIGGIKVYVSLTVYALEKASTKPLFSSRSLLSCNQHKFYKCHKLWKF